ncbi:MAG: hypothetical protein NVV82_26310 [Sporocytophaga sp.]|nr:hypothetical protein [Sporocytophaga sp.]
MISKSDSVLFNAALLERFRPVQTPAGELDSSGKYDVPLIKNYA